MAGLSVPQAQLRLPTLAVIDQVPLLTSAHVQCGGAFPHSGNEAPPLPPDPTTARPWLETRQVKSFRDAAPPAPGVAPSRARFGVQSSANAVLPPASGQAKRHSDGGQWGD